MTSRRKTTPAGARWLVLLLVAFSLLGAFIGSGRLGGTPIEQASGGWFASDATPVAPAGPAFAIWSLVYLGLACLAVWQLRSDSPRLARVRPHIALGALLNLAWIGAVQLGWIVLSLPLILAILAVLFTALLRLRDAPGGRWEAIVLDGVLGVYLGWVTVAAVANATALAWSFGYRGEPLGESGYAIAAVLVALLLALATSLAFARIAPALASVWALAWIAVARAGTDPAIAWAAAAAGLVLLAVGLSAALLRRRIRVEGNRAHRGGGRT